MSEGVSGGSLGGSQQHEAAEGQLMDPLARWVLLMCVNGAVVGLLEVTLLGQ